MSDGLATAVFSILGVLSVIALGVFFWINRPQRDTHDDAEPRIQPLFGSDAAVASDDTDEFGDDELDDADVEEDAARAEAPRAPAARAEPPQPTSAVPMSASPAGPPAPAPMAAPVAPAFAPAFAPVPQREQDRRQVFVVGRSTRPHRGGLNGTARQAPMRGAMPYLDARRGGTQADPHGAPMTMPNGGAAEDGAPMPESGSASVHFAVPMDGTLQFLPGRLEIVSGQDRGREIRFVRHPGPDGTEVTFGRNEGAPYRHVQLRDQTVSRLHARMRRADGGWVVTNLSTTNPVALNGRTLGDGEEQLLVDDDRIEMGEVVFRFRNR